MLQLQRRLKWVGLTVLAFSIIIFLTGGLLVLTELLIDQGYDGPKTLSASVTVQGESSHALPKTQYSHFIEHLGRCIKGGIWAEGESPDMFLGGVRPELLETIRSIKPAYIRWPGGCFADGYHWQDGIGPRDQRPVCENLAWGRHGDEVGPPENNRFGTDEFMALCKEVGARPMLTINLGSGTPEEAAAWVEYCNGPADSKWGAERAKNGHPEPYGVEYWFVGNETFSPGEIGRMSPKKYITVYKEFADAMRAVDPVIRLVAVGNFFVDIAGLQNVGKDINRQVLQGIGDGMDYLSIHQYVPNISLKTYLRYWVLQRHGSPSRKIYYDTLGSVSRMQYFLERCIEDVHAYSPPGKHIPLTFDEWNLWDYSMRQLIQSNYNLRDGLWVASMLNLLHRVAPDVPFANIAQMVNCIGIIWSSKDATFLTASGEVFKLYTNHAGEEYLPATVESPAMPHKTELPVLDVSATRSGERTILFFVNRHYDADLDVSCDLPGVTGKQRLSAWEIHHENPVQYNTQESPHEVTILERNDGFSLEENVLRFKMKPHSILCVELEPETA